jgi:hypothetical protein
MAAGEASFGIGGAAICPRIRNQQWALIRLVKMKNLKNYMTFRSINFIREIR